MIFRLTTAGTPVWKLGLIPVLATVLFKMTRSSPAEVDVPTSVTAAGSKQNEPQATSTRKPTVLPDLSLNDALRFDPFASLPLPSRQVEELPPAEVRDSAASIASSAPVASTPKVDPLVEKAATLRQLKVSAVFPSPSGAMAIIDSKAVREGDLLSPGVRVVEIRGTDVILRVEDGEAGAKAESGATAIR